MKKWKSISLTALALTLTAPLSFYTASQLFSADDQFVAQTDNNYTSDEEESVLIDESILLDGHRGSSGINSTEDFPLTNSSNEWDL